MANRSDFIIHIFLIIFTIKKTQFLLGKLLHHILLNAHHITSISNSFDGKFFPPKNNSILHNHNLLTIFYSLIVRLNYEILNEPD